MSVISTGFAAFSSAEIRLNSGSAAVLAKAGHVCAVVHRAGFRAGGLRGPIAVVEQVKERLNLSSVVD